jgi:outer membrane protein assembly factor BamD
MRAPQRDQTETREAIREFETFVTRYPNSSLMPEVKNRLREAKDRLSEAEFEVGRFYYRIHWYPGAIDRLSGLLKDDPEFTSRDGAYYYLGESLMKVNRGAEALPLYEKLVTEFERSDYLDDAKKRIEEIKSAQAAPGTSAPTTPATTPATPAAAPGAPAPSGAPATTTATTSPS